MLKKRVTNAERPYDSISMIFDGETLIQWACRVKIALRDLLGPGSPHSSFHEYCLHATYTQGANFDKSNYSRGPKATQFNLMKDHYDYECEKPRTDFGRARLIQKLWKIFKEREPSNSRLAWNSLPNDNFPDDKKYLGITRRKVKNPETCDQFKLRVAKLIAEYKKYPNMIPDTSYKGEYYYPYNWIDSKKRQLQDRFRVRLLQLEA